MFRNAPLLCSAAGSARGGNAPRPNGASVAAENGRNANRSRAKPSAERAERGSDPPTRRSASCAIAPPPTTSTPFTASRGMANVCERAPAASDPRISGGRGCWCESKVTREGEVMSYFSQRSRPFTNAPKQENFLAVCSLREEINENGGANESSVWDSPRTPDVSDEGAVFRLAREARSARVRLIDVPCSTRQYPAGRRRTPCPAWWTRPRG